MILVMFWPRKSEKEILESELKSTRTLMTTLDKKIQNSEKRIKKLEKKIETVHPDYHDALNDTILEEEDNIVNFREEINELLDDSLDLQKRILQL